MCFGGRALHFTPLSFGFQERQTQKQEHKHKQKQDKEEAKETETSLPPHVHETSSRSLFIIHCSWYIVHPWRVFESIVHVLRYEGIYSVYQTSQMRIPVHRGCGPRYVALRVGHLSFLHRTVDYFVRLLLMLTLMPMLTLLLTLAVEAEWSDEAKAVDD